MRQTTTATATVRRARWSVASMKDRTARAGNDAKKRSLRRRVESPLMKIPPLTPNVNKTFANLAPHAKRATSGAK